MSPVPSPPGCPRGVDAGAYVLRALTGDESEHYADHVAGCADCRREVAELATVVDTLPIAAPQATPSPALKGRIMAVVSAEAELLRAAGPEADRVPPPAARRMRWMPAFSSPLRPVLVGALACVLLAMGVVGGLLADDQGGLSTRTIDAEAPGPANAQLAVTGDRASLQLSRMPSLSEGQVYQVWFDRGDGQLRPSQTLFNVRSDGRAKVAIEESVAGVERILVTAEPSGGSLAPSGDPVITASPA